MWTQFALENIHFAIYVITAMSLMGIGWLYFDAWQVKKTLKEGLKIPGFFLLGLSFLVAVLRLETSVFRIGSVEGLDIILSIAYIMRVVGYVLVLVGLTLDPIPKSSHKTKLSAVAPLIWILSFIFPVLAVLAGMLYLYRSTEGKEDHLKPVAYGFLFIALFELISYRFLFSQTSDIGLYNILKPYGIVWIAQNGVLGIGALLLGRWVWYYLLRRFQTQLFAIYALSIVTIFLITTASFTGLLLSNVQRETETALRNNVSLLSHVIESKKSESVSNAQVLAQNDQIKTLIKSGSKTKILEVAQELSNKSSQQSLLIVNAQGQAILKDQDREGSQDFFSDDPLVKRALAGQTISSITSVDDAVAPQVLVRGAVPVIDTGKVIGVVVSGNQLDEYFVDSVKKSTSFELTVYGQNAIAATSLSAELGRSRPIGLRLKDKNIVQSVLERSQIYAGGLKVLNVPYFSAFAPLTDADGRAVGMLALMQPQLSVLQAAGRSIELTFLMSITLLLFAMIPAYLISKYLSDQLS